MLSQKNLILTILAVVVIAVLAYSFSRCGGRKQSCHTVVSTKDCCNKEKKHCKNHDQECCDSEDKCKNHDQECCTTGVTPNETTETPVETPAVTTEETSVHTHN